MPIYLQPIGWISPLWHTTELGRYFGYGQQLSGTSALNTFSLLDGDVGRRNQDFKCPLH